MKKIAFDPAKSGVRNYWNYGSRFYDETPGLCRDRENEIWKELLAESMGPGPKVVLDVGTGTGYIALLLAEMGHRVTGIDFSTNMLEIARRKTLKYRTSVSIMEGDVENMPFATATFDAITARYVLWTLAQPRTALKEWTRVLKPGGRVVIIDGFWEPRGLLQNICRINFALYRRLKFGKQLLTDMYSKGLSRLLPHPTGVHKEDIAGYMAEAGLVEITCTDLDHIRETQKRQAPWYLKYAYDYPTYLFSGQTIGRV
jgi:ubiquinone/menaquinone biosynthesis C-methylase UbiE